MLTWFYPDPPCIYYFFATRAKTNICNLQNWMVLWSWLLHSLCLHYISDQGSASAPSVELLSWIGWFSHASEIPMTFFTVLSCIIEVQLNSSITFDFVREPCHCLFLRDDLHRPIACIGLNPSINCTFLFYLSARTKKCPIFWALAIKMQANLMSQPQPIVFGHTIFTYLSFRNTFVCIRKKSSCFVNWKMIVWRINCDSLTN